MTQQNHVNPGFLKHEHTCMYLPPFSLSLPPYTHTLYILYTDKIIFKTKEKRSFNKCFHLCFLFSKMSTLNKYIYNKIVLDILSSERYVSKFCFSPPEWLALWRTLCFFFEFSQPTFFKNNDDYIDFVTGKNNFIMKVIKITPFRSATVFWNVISQVFLLAYG